MAPPLSQYILHFGYAENLNEENRKSMRLLKLDLMASRINCGAVVIN